jgi:hypothetical protein
MSAAVAAMENLGILDVLKAGEVRAADAVMQRMASIALAHQHDIKAALNIGISDKDTPIAIAQKLLGKLGLKLNYLRREGPRGNRQRVYGYTPPGDNRDEVFASWLVRDKEALSVMETAEVKTASTNSTSKSLVSTPGNKNITTPCLDTKQVDTQLSPQENNNEDAPSQKQQEVSSAEPILVSCWKFGRMFQFRLQRFIDEATAEIQSVLTGELFQVPVNQLAQWGSSA